MGPLSFIKDVSRIFSKYGVRQHDSINNASCLIQFEEKKSALKMMLEMTKTLTTNDIRFSEHAKTYPEDSTINGGNQKKEDQPEEGEVSSDDDGEILENTVTNCIYKIGEFSTRTGADN